MKRKLVRPLMGIALVLLLAWLGATVWRARQARTRGEAAAEAGRWAVARAELSRYLRLHPWDQEARLRLAEALVRDEFLPPGESVPWALEELRRIPDGTPRAAGAQANSTGTAGSRAGLPPWSSGAFQPRTTQPATPPPRTAQPGTSPGARARTQEGRLQLLILHQPAAAERSFRRAIALDDSLLDAHYMLWKLLDLTGRSEQAGPVFWKVHELTPEPQRGQRLREWYLSQFYPSTANPQWERMMGLLGPDEEPDARTELRRYGVFRQSEPREPLAVAAIAGWLRAEGDPGEAVKLLEQSAESLDGASREPLFVATWVASLFDLGEFERAVDVFRQWPEPHAGYAYWKWQAMLRDEVDRDFAAALAAYDQALQHWPGPADWRSMNRQANCLARLGRSEEAQAKREQAKAVERQMEEALHQRLRSALGRLDVAERLEPVARFYRELGCQRESEAWDAVIQRLRSPEEPALNNRP